MTFRQNVNSTIFFFDKHLTKHRVRRKVTLDGKVHSTKLFSAKCHGGDFLPSKQSVKMNKYTFRGGTAVKIVSRFLERGFAKTIFFIVYTPFQIGIRVQQTRSHKSCLLCKHHEDMPI